MGSMSETHTPGVECKLLLVGVLGSQNGSEDIQKYSYLGATHYEHVYELDLDSAVCHNSNQTISISHAYINSPAPK